MAIQSAARGQRLFAVVGIVEVAEVAAAKPTARGAHCAHPTADWATGHFTIFVVASLAAVATVRPPKDSLIATGVLAHR